MKETATSARESFYRPVSHVIFDMDGLLLSEYSNQRVYCAIIYTLLDYSQLQVQFLFRTCYIGTEEIYEEADRKMTAKYGIPLRNDVRMKTLGSSEQAVASVIVTEHNLPISVEQYRHEVDELLDDMLKEATLMDGTLFLS